MSQKKHYHPYYPTGYYPFPFQNTYYQSPYFIMPNTQQPTQNNQTEMQNDENEPLSISDHLDKIYNKLTHLEEENKQIKEELTNKKTINVENVNYKIQDLHVEDLSGALLVGLTSWGDAEELKELLAENGPVTFNDINTDEIQNSMMNHQTDNQQNEEEQ
ncbi:spore germination protein GerPC [Ornithinibacillus salinisoli]|uniref:Spore germination protein GerPC n=1 Tax=Ornithinibacillus salinisoli TaxID=1848459 RepID=A0ABW4VV78_9BACI